MLDDRDDGLNTCDHIDGLLHDTFRNVVEGFRHGLNKEATKFFKLVEDGKEDLYSGCKSFFKTFLLNSTISIQVSQWTK